MAETVTEINPDCALKIAANPDIEINNMGKPLVCTVEGCKIQVRSKGIVKGIKRWFNVEGVCISNISPDIIYNRN